jgi:hypothetical protein
VTRVLATADRVADQLRPTAAKRDQASGSPREEVELLGTAGHLDRGARRSRR